MVNDTNWNDSLDEILQKFQNGEFKDESLSEFSQRVDTATGQRRTTYTTYSSYTTTGRYTTSSSRSTSRVFVPYVNRTVESGTYPTRYQHIINCFDSLVYSDYPQDKKDGYQQCLERYRKEIETSPNNLKDIERMVVSDISTYKSKVTGATVEGYLLGYYDCLMMIKKVLNSTKLARLQIINKKVTH